MLGSAVVLDSMLDPLTHGPPNARVSGALLALACGDALGAPSEFLSRAEIAQKWGTLRDLVGGGGFGWAPGEWTDDTAMALCVAEGILAVPDDPIASVGERFLEWYRSRPKDIGNATREALASYRGSWAGAASTTPAVRAGKAAGNGSLMRTLAVALAYPGTDEMHRNAARISAMTHWDSQAEVCCAIYCSWIARLLAGEAADAAYAAALDGERRRIAEHPSPSADTPGSAPLPQGFWEGLAAAALPQFAIAQLQNNGYVLESLQSAVFCVLRSDSLEEALVSAANLGGDTDTIAAIAGGAAGAHWGEAAIPGRWLDRLHQRERILRTAGALATLRDRLVYARSPNLSPFSHYPVTERVLAGRNPLTATDIEVLAGLGVTHILDLREDVEWTAPGRHGREALDAAARAGMKRASVPIADVQPPSSAALSDACHFLDSALLEEKTGVYVHCRAGKERTGAVLAAWWAHSRGVTAEQALGELCAADCPIDPTKEQREAVESWLRTNRG